MKIYTKTGDSGSTGLLGGHRVSKSDPRPEAYGTLDELNVEIGALLGLLEDGDALIPELRRIQKRLLLIGSRLAALPGSPEVEMLEALKSKDCEWMESAIDRMLAEMPPMEGFVLPGGHPTAVQAHRARTLCRRAERRTVALSEQDVEDNGCHYIQMEIMYLNRLSDYLFAVARYCNHVNAVKEYLWKKW
jgi:cob(I)alamin adenosyltransferase